MSRKWERMVQKNMEQVNRRRSKSGNVPISVTEPMDVFYGRSWFLPALLIACSFFFAIVSSLYYEGDTLFWFTVAAYFLLGIIYFLRRPYIKIGRSRLATRRLGMERYFEAGDIEKISVMRGAVQIHFKGKRSGWTLTRFQHLYNIPAVSDRLKRFAEQNRIEFVDQTA
jgi:hypothetical protein